MKTISYLLTILFLALLLSCSEEPPTNISNESLSKKPAPPPPVVALPPLDQGTKYIVGNSGSIIFIWDGHSLSQIWSRSLGTPFFGLGDFTDDGYKELIVIKSISEGHGHNKVTRLELLIFKEGDLEPSETVFLREVNGFQDAVWDMKIVDIDGDGQVELIIVFRDQVEIWEYGSNGFYLSDSSYYFSSSDSPWRADFGDFDNDSIDEIIIAFAGNYWRIYDYDGSSITSVFESSTFNEIGNLDCAKISDIDYDGTMEVVGGNYPDKILLWEAPYTNQPVFNTFPVFAYAPWAIGVGELDGDQVNGKEIIAGEVFNGGLHLLHYIGGSLVYGGEVYSGISVSMDGIVMSNIVNDNNLEIIIGTGDGLLILDNSFNYLFSDNVGELERVICQ